MIEEEINTEKKNTMMTMEKPPLGNEHPSLISPDAVKGDVLKEMQIILDIIADLQCKQLAVLNKQTEALTLLNQQVMDSGEKMEAQQVINAHTTEQFKTLAEVLAHYQEKFEALASSC